MTKSLLMWLLITLFLLNPTLGVVSQEHYPDYPIKRIKLEGYGEKFELAVQVLGISGSIDWTELLENPDTALYDIRVWVWKKPGESWDFHNVNLNRSSVREVYVCEDPMVMGLMFSINDKYFSLLYPQYLLDGVHKIVRFDVPVDQDWIVIENCRSE